MKFMRRITYPINILKRWQMNLSSYLIYRVLLLVKKFFNTYEQVLPWVIQSITLENQILLSKLKYICLCLFLIILKNHFNKNVRGTKNEHFY